MQESSKMALDLFFKRILKEFLMTSVDTIQMIEH